MDSSEKPIQIIHDLASKLQTTDAITDILTLLTLLSLPLDFLGLLPPQFRIYIDNGSAYPVSPLTEHPFPDSSIRKYLPQIQRALITKVLPVWAKDLQENDAVLLVEQYFCPGSIHYPLPVAGQIAACAYATLLSFSESEYTVGLLQRLVREYPLDRLFWVAFGNEVGGELKRNFLWEDCVRDLCMVPVKVANAFASKTREIPSLLENASYLDNLSLRTEELIFSLALRSKISAGKLSALSYLLIKLVNTGLFPPRPPTARSQSSFFVSTLPQIRSRILLTPIASYNRLWSNLFFSLPTLPLQSILTSLFSSLSILPDALIFDVKMTTRALVKREALVLEGFVGRISPSSENEELWQVASSVILNMSREWNEAHARVFVCWISGRDSKALETFLDLVLETWASSEFIKHSLISRHKYTTSLLLLILSYLSPSSSSSIHSLASNPVFIRGMSTYISHMDHSIRRCGMLVAEEVAKLAGKKLEFGDWEGPGSILNWTRDVRSLSEARDIDADLDILEQPYDEERQEAKSIGIEEEIPAQAIAQTAALSSGSCPVRLSLTEKSDACDSDDSLSGYASPSSSRSPSPSSDNLYEIENDPSLNVGVKKVLRPVYLAQLGELLRGPGMQIQKPDEPHEADRVEMALSVAEELVRKKRVYGTELDENAVNLVYGFLPLNDNYDLDGFVEKRQGVMNALVACAPKKSAPALIEEFFKNQYSTDQRFVALNALAIGARELASLPIPPSFVPLEKTAFPSKMLPAPLHKKYITTGQTIIPRLMDEISKHSLTTESSTAEHHPELIRERRLRIQKSTRITEIAPHDPLNPFSEIAKPVQAKPQTKFVDVAAEFFIVPLINRFWTFVHDEQAREEHTYFQKGRERYRGVGTGLILNPVVLTQFLRTLGILVHASQNAPEWLAIIAPDALEVAVTIGTRPILHMEMEEDESDKEGEIRQMIKEASVLTVALEVALVVLNGALNIDGGKMLGLDHTTLVLAAGEWAEKVFASLEKGLRIPGAGGLQEAQLNRAAAGVLLKVDELSSKWRRSMLDTR